MGDDQLTLYKTPRTVIIRVYYVCLILFARKCIHFFSTIPNLASFGRKWDHSLLVTSTVRKLTMGVQWQTWQLNIIDMVTSATQTCSLVAHSVGIAFQNSSTIPRPSIFKLTTHRSALKEPTRWACKRRLPDKGHRMARIQHPSGRGDNFKQT